MVWPVRLLAILFSATECLADEPAPLPVERRDGKIVHFDVAKSELLVKLNDEQFDLHVFPDAKCEVLFANRKHKLADYVPGMEITLNYRGETKNPFKLEARWPNMETTIKSVDATKNALAIRMEGNNGFEFEVPLTLAPDVAIVIDTLPSGLADLTIGKKVWVSFAPDKKTVYTVEAEAEKDDLAAAFLKLDATTISVVANVQGYRDQRRVPLTFKLAEKPTLRLAGKDVVALDFAPTMRLRLRFAADRQTVTHVWGAPLVAEKP